MNEHIINAHNAVVRPDEDVYVLGDLMLGDSAKGIECIKRMNGKLHIVRGNHDTDKRWAMYAELSNVVEQAVAIVFTYDKHHFYLSHYPTLTGNLEKESLKQMTLNLFGHTHQNSNFYMDMPYLYHCGVDSHKCFPVNIDTIISEMYAKVDECKEFLDEQNNTQETLVPVGQEEGNRQIPEPQEAAAINWDFETRRCDKCVTFHTECPGPSRYDPGKCPPGHDYKRDPPDGGYYG